MGGVCSCEEGKITGYFLYQIEVPFLEMKHNVEVSPQHHDLFYRIDRKIKFHDCRKDMGLSWYSLTKYNFYLLGKLSKNKSQPYGPCFLYSMPLAKKDSPIAIFTYIDVDYVFSDKTLIVYSDSFYLGSIKTVMLYTPEAEGKGLFVSKYFIYEGDFQKGLPHGYGKYKTKYFEYTGKFKSGLPCGKGIYRSAYGLFIGETDEKGNRLGHRITPHNYNIFVEYVSYIYQLIDMVRHSGFSIANDH